MLQGRVWPQGEAEGSVAVGDWGWCYQGGEADSCEADDSVRVMPLVVRPVREVNLTAGQ
jgi:hypothetical protein